MKFVSKSLSLLLLAAVLAPGAALAQRQRAVGDPTRPVSPPEQQQQQEGAQDGKAVPKVSVAAPPAPPKVVPAKYMGGFASYRKKQEGMLTFDDRNQRLVFRDKKEKEVISISYDAVMVAFADHETRRLMGNGTQQVVLGTAGILGLPGLLFKKKFEYLTIQFEDPETYLRGTTQFKLKDKDIIDSVAYALAQRSGLVQQGAIYTRRRAIQPASDEKSSNP
jgi:flagellar motor protein MotB